jgi:hypothetical protein
MAQDKKGGFFSMFKKSSAPVTPSAPVAPPVRDVPVPERKAPAVGAEPPKPAAVSKPAAVNAASSETGVDTVASFNLLCQALVDINKSQLQVVDLALKTLAVSVNKIADTFKPES